jgi:hypothetical protein
MNNSARKYSAKKKLTTESNVETKSAQPSRSTLFEEEIEETG